MRYTSNIFSDVLSRLNGSLLLILIIAIVGFLISIIITLGIIRLTLCFPPIRHLAQDIFYVISHRD